jgi:hypothetical protein
MLQQTPALPARGGPPKALTGIIRTVVGEIKVTTADQLPEPSEQPEPAPVGVPRNMTKRQTAQLMKDRHEWMSAVDLFSIDDETEWNAHKEALKLIPNMSRKEKMEQFTKLRQLAQSYGIGYNDDARLFFKMPLPGDDQDL